jgi:predicted regulator of Ras-like GTPase activity (Roadblock/LC7/MglB family)
MSTPENYRGNPLSHPNQQALIERIHVLQRSSPDVQAAALVSVDGLIIASALLPEMSEDRVSAMSAAILSLGEQIGKEMGRGNLEQIHIKGENGYIVLMAVGDKAVLTSLVHPHAKLGVLFLDMRHAAEDIEKMLVNVNEGT